MSSFFKLNWFGKKKISCKHCKRTFKIPKELYLDKFICKACKGIESEFKEENDLLKSKVSLLEKRMKANESKTLDPLVLPSELSISAESIRLDPLLNAKWPPEPDYPKPNNTEEQLPLERGFYQGKELITKEAFKKYKKERLVRVRPKSDIKHKYTQKTAKTKGVEFDVIKNRYQTYIEFNDDYMELIDDHHLKINAVISRWYAELEQYDKKQLEKSDALGHLLKAKSLRTIRKNNISVLGIDFENRCIDEDAISILNEKELA